MTLEILKRSLHLAGATQQQIADNAEVTLGMVNAVLNGHKNSAKVMETAKALLAEKIESDPMAAALVRAFTKEVEG